MQTNTVGFKPKSKNRHTYTVKQLPSDGFVRLPSVLAVLGISKTSYINGVKEGKFPEGKLLSARCRVYPVSEIRALLSKIEEQAAA